MKIKKIYNKLGANNKIIVKNVLGAFFVKGFALFVSLYTLPSYISFFNNNEILGLWFVLLSFLNWILNFDLGIGNGLRNHLTVSLTLGRQEETRRLISSSYFSIGVIVVVLSTLFPFFIKNVDLNRILNISTHEISSAALYKSIVIVFVGVMLQFWLRLVSSILYALQMSSLNNVIALCTNLLILLYVKFAPSYDNNTNLVTMSIVHLIAVILPLVLISIYVFGFPLRNCRPSIKFVSKDRITKVLSLGGIFFFIQLAYMVIMSTNEYLITVTSTNSNNITYQAYHKIFSLLGTVFALMLTPIWSVVTKAKAEKNILWIKATYKRFLALGVLFFFLELLLVLLIKPIMRIWLGYIPTEPVYVPILFALLGSLMVFVSILSSIANGIGKLKCQAICYGVGSALKIPLSFLFVGVLNSWVGVVIANLLCMLIYCLIEPIMLNKYFNNNI